MNWDMYDYIAATVLILGTLGAMALANTLISNRRLRLAALVACPIILSLIWAQLAVGLI